jgi:hypothetical protein
MRALTSYFPAMTWPGCKRSYREGVGTGEEKNGGEVAGEEAVVPRGGCTPAVPLLTPPQPQR